LLVVIVLGCLSTGCSSGAGEAAPVDPLGHESAAQILTSALAAARTAGAAYYVLTSLGPADGQKQTVTGESGSTDAIQVITGGGARWEELVVEGKAFISGNAKGLEEEGFPTADALRYSNRWISVAPTESLYKTVIGELGLYPALEDLAPIGKLTLTAPTVVYGQHVVGVRGAVRTSTGSSARGTCILYVADGKPTLPVGYAAEARDHGQTVTETGSFADWGKAVILSAPAQSVAFSSIRQGS
jgi:hypothetical protein